MVMKWYKNNVWAAVIVTFFRIYLGWKWLEPGWHKMTGGFDATGFLNRAVETPMADKTTGALLYPNYTYFIEHFALPNVKLINFMIPVGEFLIGLGLILGGLTLFAGFFGLLLNTLFLLAGTVSTNPWLMVIGFLVFTAGANAGRFGLDYYLLPLIGKYWAKLTHRERKDAGTDTGVGTGRIILK